MSRPNLVLVFVVTSLLLWGCSSSDEGLTLTASQEQQIAERIAPAGHSVMEGQVVVASPAMSSGAGRAGDDIYNTNCMACHNSGVAGAPMYGDVSAWATRLEQGIETVYANAINGIRAMPARGTCMTCSDDEVKSAIDYILDNSK
tara:strand:- start:803 stop:1237 length:435 start_codon:yes stop_codon:yes gene_type:complete